MSGVPLSDLTQGLVLVTPLLHVLDVEQILLGLFGVISDSGQLRSKSLMDIGMVHVCAATQSRIHHYTSILLYMYKYTIYMYKYTIYMYKYPIIHVQVYYIHVQIYYIHVQVYYIHVQVL